MNQYLAQSSEETRLQQAAIKQQTEGYFTVLYDYYLPRAFHSGVAPTEASFLAYCHSHEAEALLGYQAAEMLRREGMAAEVLRGLFAEAQHKAWMQRNEEYSRQMESQRIREQELMNGKTT